MSNKKMILMLAVIFLYSTAQSISDKGQQISRFLKKEKQKPAQIATFLRSLGVKPYTDNWKNASILLKVKKL